LVPALPALFFCVVKYTKKSPRFVQLLNALKAAKHFLLFLSVTPLREPFHFKQTSSQVQHPFFDLHKN
jgi:hypothetical protein